MSSPRRLFRPARSRSGKGGFTLVELLVVIAIIALLAGVAIGPITGALKTAKDNAAMQTSHSLYLADFQYSIDSQGSFADGTDAGTLCQLLFNGGYLTDPTILVIKGGNAQAYVGTTPGTGIQKSMVSWDFFGVNSTGATAGPVGISTNDPDQLPLLWSTGNTIGAPTTGAYAQATVNTGKNPLGTDGIPVAYKSGASQFKKVDQIGPPAVITKFIDSSIIVPTGMTYVVREGSE